MAALLTVLVPALGGRAIPGQPQAIDIAAPPQIGDCVLTPPRPPSGLSGRLTTDDAGRVQVGPCTGPRYGEVVGLLSGQVLSSSLDSGRSAVPDEDLAGAACDRMVEEYQEVPPELRDGALYAGTWAAPLFTPTLPMRADALQRAAGRDWTACVAVHFAGGTELGTFPSTLRDSYGTGSPPPGSGECGDAIGTGTAANGAGAVLSPVPCDRPHQVQVFGYDLAASLDALSTDPATGTTARSDADLQASCAGLVALLTRMPDPTAGGSLAVSAGSASAADQGGTGHWVDPSQPVRQCQVIAPAGRLLSGTLLGLDRRPVPWA
ncbi:hypothetical protein GCM10009818_19030 [Nakamurella flavida]